LVRGVEKEEQRNGDRKSTREAGYSMMFNFGAKGETRGENGESASEPFHWEERECRLRTPALRGSRVLKFYSLYLIVTQEMSWSHHPDNEERKELPLIWGKKEGKGWGEGCRRGANSTWKKRDERRAQKSRDRVSKKREKKTWNPPDEGVRVESV